MLKFPPELIVHKGNVFSVLYVVGGLLMMATAGGLCVDVAVRTGLDPANLLRLTGLLSLRKQRHAVKSTEEPKLKRLYFTDSFNSLLSTRKTLQGALDFKVLCWFPDLKSTCANCVTARRCRVYYILICVASSRPVPTLCIESNGRKLKTCNPSKGLRWLKNFSSEAQARGDKVLLFFRGPAGQLGAGSATNEPTRLALGLSALLAVFLWMLLPHVAVCAAICLGWKLQQYVHRVLQSSKYSDKH